MAKILKAENIQTDLIGSNGNSSISIQRNNSSLLTLSTSDNIGIGTTSPSHKLEVRGSSYPKICITSDDQAADFGANFRIDLKNASSSLFEGGVISVRHTSSNQTAGAENTYMSFWTRSSGSITERLRIDSSGNVGIGTTSPSDILHVSKANGVSIFESTGVSSVGIRLRTNSLDRWQIGCPNASADLAIYTGAGATERLRIDSSGNVGIGTTSPTANLHVVKSTSQTDIDNATQAVSILNTASDTSGNLTGIRLRQDNGTNVAQSYIGLSSTGNSATRANLIIATPNTSGNATERLRIDSSGNVGIGGTPSTLLHLQATSPSLRIQAASGNSGVLDFYRTASVNSGQIASESTNALVFSTNTSTNSALTERLRIDSSGIIKSNGASNTYGGTGSLSLNANSGSAVDLELRVGNTNVGYFYADSTNVQIANAQAGYFALLTSNTERLRITSDGVVLFAKNTSSVSNVGYRFDTNGEFYTSHAASTSAGGTLYVYSTGASAYRFYVGLGGTVNATNTAIAAISDVRLKENIRDIDAGLSEILKLKPRTFDWKEGKGANTKNARGFIAQEIEQVFPDLVDKWRDPAPEGEEPYKSVRQDLIPVLVKAIQELSAKVAALEAA